MRLSLFFFDRLWAVTDEKFQNQINGSKLNLIQFSASWCGPCQQLKPIIEKISNDMADKVDCYYHEVINNTETQKSYWWSLCHIVNTTQTSSLCQNVILRCFFCESLPH